MPLALRRALPRPNLPNPMQSTDTQTNPHTEADPPLPWPGMQKTIARPVQAEGIAVHAGEPCTMRLVPAAEGTGVVFIRTDLPGAPEIPARSESVRADALQRMTVLASSDDPEVRVGMTEHLLAACVGLGVTNLRVEVSGPECPIFDGSAARYVELLTEAGIETQARPARTFRLRRTVELHEGDAQIIAIPAERTRLTFFGAFAHVGIADQQVTFEPTRDDFIKQIAPARTFCFYEDVEKLREAGLIKGGSLDCAIVLRDGKPMNTSYRLTDELARHKLLDLMGDLALLGAPVRALISAHATGHALHYRFVCKLREHLEEDIPS